MGKRKVRTYFIPLASACVVCGSPYIQHHHIFEGTANRKKSDKYNYIIPLCQKHHTGSEGIHFNNYLALAWKRRAQEHYEETHTREEFIREFGRSYL